MLSAPSYWDSARAMAALSSVRAGPSAARRIGSGRIQAHIGILKRGAEPLAGRRAELSARREDRVGIDVMADFACDVGLARRLERERDDCGFEFLVGKDRAECPH